MRENLLLLSWEDVITLGHVDQYSTLGLLGKLERPLRLGVDFYSRSQMHLPTIRRAHVRGVITLEHMHSISIPYRDLRAIMKIDVMCTRKPAARKL